MSMRRVETLYEVLGTHPNASAAELKAAFKRQALALHPDKGGSKEAFQQALRAFEVLSDDASRAEYHKSLLQAKGSKRPRQESARGRTAKRRKTEAGAKPSRPTKQGKCPERGPRATGAGRAHRAKASFRLQSLARVKGQEDQLLQRVFTLLQKLTAVRRRQLLQEGFTQAQRKALETWALTQSPRPKAPKPRPAPRAPGPKRRAAPSTAPGAGPRNSATRGIASFHRNGQVYHQVSVCVQTLCMTARKVKDLSKALDILMILMEIKQQVKRMDAPDAFVQGMTNSVPTILREHEVTAEDILGQLP
ncbi:unnamed protein product [Effrenium voratum]|nr:unnamed protein product [Effrenium voratum]